jgi:lipopolysaccharide cholinephosphotransferase
MKEDFTIYNGEGTILRKAQYIMLDIIKTIDEICKKHNINYWIDYGTLIGAKRHSGFIPWDDDLDISVSYDDFKKLKKILKSELPDYYAYQDWKSEKKFTFKHAKIRHKNSYLEEDFFKKGDLKYQGIFIDIFPTRKVFSPKLKNAIDAIYGRCFRRIRRLNNSNFEFIIGLLFYPLATLLVWIFNLINFLIPQKKFITNIFGGVYNNYYHKSSLIFPVNEINFEGVNLLCPNNVDAYLKGIYGDYMIIPNKENRAVHASIIEIYENK